MHSKQILTVVEKNNHKVCVVQTGAAPNLSALCPKIIQEVGRLSLSAGELMGL